MIKKTIVETIYEYDKDGKVTRKIVTETKEEDTNTYWPSITQPYVGSPVYCNDSDSTACHTDTATVSIKSCDSADTTKLS